MEEVTGESNQRFLKALKSIKAGDEIVLKQKPKPSPFLEDPPSPRPIEQHYKRSKSMQLQKSRKSAGQAIGYDEHHLSPKLESMNGDGGRSPNGADALSVNGASPNGSATDEGQPLS